MYLSAIRYFQQVIPEAFPDEIVAPAKVKQLIFCSGKVYYDLLDKREALHCNDVAILRLEQYYPNYMGQLKRTLSAYADETPVFWVQEEPENMGAWRWLYARHGSRLFDRWPLEGIYRHRSASPATGSASSHKLEQQQLLTVAFAEE